jgi:hypothetical protein
MTELLVALGLMAGVVGVSVALVQLMHWSEAKRAEVLRRHITQAYSDGFQRGREERDHGV